MSDHPTTVAQLPLNARVLHPTFGRGTVTGHGKLEESKGDFVCVAFDRHGEKVLDPRFAKLTLLGDSELLRAQFRKSPEEEFASAVVYWRDSVEQMEKYGAGNCSEEFRQDVGARDQAYFLLAHHPEFAHSAAANALAAIDCRYVAIGRRRTERFAPPLPWDIAAGRWWWRIVPMPRRSGVRRNRVWRGDVYNLVMKFANCGEVITRDAQAMGREARVDFIMQLVHPPQLYPRHARFIAHCADFLRACAARNGQTPSCAEIAPRLDEQYGVVYAVRLEATTPPVVVRGELRRVREFKFEWLPDEPEYIPMIEPDPEFDEIGLRGELEL